MVFGYYEGPLLQDSCPRSPSVPGAIPGAGRRHVEPAVVGGLSDRPRGAESGGWLFRLRWEEYSRPEPNAFRLSLLRDARGIARGSGLLSDAGNPVSCS